MSKKKTKIAFILEGTKTEPIIFKKLQSVFFKDIEIIPIMLPACTNIYALWSKIYKDIDIDIIELVKEISCNQKYRLIDSANEEDFRFLNRDDFSEIYLFFDYDGHNNNLPCGCDHYKTLQEMLNTFDNETENGKMYISYPMIEAIKHFASYKTCDDKMSCYINIECGRHYKNFVAAKTLNNDLRKYEINEWRFILKQYICSIYCLFDLDTGVSQTKGY